MKSLTKILLIAALSIVVPAGVMAQSVGNTDPAKADTTDPNSAPKTKPAPAKVKKSSHVKKHHKTM